VTVRDPVVKVSQAEWLSPEKGDGIVSRKVQVTVNDEPHALPDGATVADLVAALGLGTRRIAIEVNRAVVPRAAYPSTTLHDGDTVEVIHFVGGG
jgi:sulfur carrier protein